MYFPVSRNIKKLIVETNLIITSLVICFQQNLLVTVNFYNLSRFHEIIRMQRPFFLTLLSVFKTTLLHSARKAVSDNLTALDLISVTN